MDQQTIDLKRQLQVIEQEAVVLRSKVQSLESENEKLTTESKRLQLLRGTKKSDKNIEKYVDQIATLEVELGNANKKIRELEAQLLSSASDNSLKELLTKTEDEKKQLENTLKKLKDDSAKSFRNRVPKRVTNFTSKEQLKVMVNDLENEIGELLVALKNEDAAKQKIEEELKQIRSKTKSSELEDTLKELAEMTTKLKAMEKELDEERSNARKEKSKCDDVSKTLLKTKDSLNKSNEEKKQLKEQKEKLKEDYNKLVKEKDRLDNDVSRLKKELDESITTQDSLKLQIIKLENLKIELEDRDREIVSLKTELDETKKSLKDVSKKHNKVTLILS